MLNYITQYNIANGILHCFKNFMNTRMLSVNHKQDKIDKFISIFPNYKFETYPKDNFVITCIYIMWKKNPSSIYKMIDYLQEIDFNRDVAPFKNDILSYKFFVTRDVDFIKTTIGKPDSEQIYKLYKTNNIKFYTFYWYLRNMQIESRKIQIEMQKIKSIMLYIKFSEESLKYIDSLFNESDILGKEVNAI